MPGLNTGAALALAGTERETGFAFATGRGGGATGAVEADSTAGGSAESAGTTLGLNMGSSGFSVQPLSEQLPSTTAKAIARCKFIQWNSSPQAARISVASSWLPSRLSSRLFNRFYFLACDTAPPHLMLGDRDTHRRIGAQSVPNTP
jgi:hypothetical protein